MKSKQDHITYWIEQADDDWEAVETLYAGKKYLQSLFFTHLVIEKICKSLWIKYNDGNIPPRTHNLIYILSETEIELSETESEFLLNLNRFQLEGRYPDYMTKMYKICNKDFTKTMIDKAKNLKICLLKNLQ
ncbi:MAG: HEPN domain-containing protein [Bacteroidales bacterium]|nr:HEPN domain-containing protein [Bacteroidales bacterium]